MKKVLAVLVLVSLFSVAAMAGPLIGVQIAPAIGAAAGFVVGWEFNNFNLEVAKSDLVSWAGLWTVGAIWTPAAETFSYRAGVKLFLYWTGGILYNGFSAVVGAAKTWDAFQLYGELDITSTGVIAPVLGVNFFFGALGGTEEVLE